MTPTQLLLLGLLAVIGIALLFSVAVLFNAAAHYHQTAASEKSLLKRLEATANQTIEQTPRKKFPIDWSR